MKKLTILLIFLLCVSFFAASQDSESWRQQLKKYSLIYSLIKEYYPENVDTEKLVYASIRGLLKSLDPHSYFLDTLSLRSMNEDQQGNYFGIGIRITKYEEKLTVVAPLSGTPAYKLGIMPGDVIVEINKKKTPDMALEDAMKMLRGAKGTFVDIKISREGIEELLPFHIKRAEIPLNSVSYSLSLPDAPKIGIISIRVFGNTTVEEFRENLDYLLKKKKIKGLIMDLRGNSGGSLYAAINLSDLFLDKDKVIVSVRGRKYNQTFKSTKKPLYPDLPLVILINRASASASEIVASALQENHKATVIGTRSWGKGLVETVHQLPLNSAIALTTAKYYTPSGKCLQRDFSKLDDYYTTVYNDDYDTDSSINGGVSPDIFVKERIYSPLVINIFAKGLIFKFARQIINQKGSAVNRSFKVSTPMIKNFKTFLKENKIEFDPVEFKKDLTTIKYIIRREVFALKYSPIEGFKVFLESDPVTEKSVTHLKKNGRVS